MLKVQILSLQKTNKNYKRVVFFNKRSNPPPSRKSTPNALGGECGGLQLLADGHATESQPPKESSKRPWQGASSERVVFLVPRMFFFFFLNVFFFKGVFFFLCGLHIKAF